MTLPSDSTAATPFTPCKAPGQHRVVSRRVCLHDHLVIHNMQDFQTSIVIKTWVGSDSNEGSNCNRQGFPIKTILEYLLDGSKPESNGMPVGPCQQKPSRRSDRASGACKFEHISHGRGYTHFRRVQTRNGPSVFMDLPCRRQDNEQPGFPARISA